MAVRSIAIARHFVPDEETGRDVAQEAFLRLYRNLHRYDPERRFYTWFYRIVVHLAIDWASLLRRDLKEQVEGVLSVLPEKYQLLLVLRDVEGFTAKEIAEISGSNHATVRWRLHRARQIFRDSWVAAGFAPLGPAPAADAEDADGGQG
jgi:RNA polymerase sigma-70 factor (ECF subfamily)